MKYYQKFKFLVNIFLSFVILFLLTSCVSRKSINSNKIVYITNDSTITLLPTYAIEKNIEMFQKVEGTYKNKSFQIDAFTIINENEINVTLLNTFATTLGNLNYDGENTYFESSLISGNINPAYIIADFQMCFYSTDYLQNSFNNSNLTFVVGNNSERHYREIYDQNQNKIISVEYFNNRIEYKNLLRGYSYTIYGDFDDR